MDYEEHRKNRREALDAIDCITKKSTHLERQAGADLLRDAGYVQSQQCKSAAVLLNGFWLAQLQQLVAVALWLQVPE